MSETNVELFKRGLTAFHAGDVDGMLALSDPEVAWEPLRSGVEGVWRGHQGIRDFLKDNADSFDVFRAEYHPTDIGGGRVLAIGSVHVRGKGSGIETDIPSAVIVTYREGRVLSWKDYGDAAAARAEADV